MDMITLAMAKAYSDSKGGYSEPSKAYTYDGILEGKEYVEAQPGKILVKISDEICYYDTIESVSLTGEKGSGTLGKEKLVFEELDEAGNIAILCNGLELGTIVNETFADVFSPGIWVLYEVNELTGITYVSKIQLTETIHPIDPKYLPGVTIRMLESVLDFGEIDEHESGAYLTLSDELLAELNTAPVAFMMRCKQTINGAPIYATALFTPVELENVGAGYNSVFVFMSGYTVYSVTIATINGVWMGKIGICSG